MAYWLVKSDPDSYSWEKMLKDKETIWDGVRNYQARNYLSQMRKDDKVLFYHSGDDKSVMGIISVSKKAFQDPTTDDERWLAVKLSKPKSMKMPVPLTAIKTNPKLRDILLLKQSRLSVLPLTEAEYKEVLSLGNTV